MVAQVMVDFPNAVAIPTNYGPPQVNFSAFANLFEDFVTEDKRGEAAWAAVSPWM
jgi:hypothetical protein